jgi:ribosomal protein L17
MHNVNMEELAVEVRSQTGGYYKVIFLVNRENDFQLNLLIF